MKFVFDTNTLVSAALSATSTPHEAYSNWKAK